MKSRSFTAATLAGALSISASGAATAGSDPDRYVGGASELMMQACGAFLTGKPMAPVLSALEAWPAHEPLRQRLLGDSKGAVFLTRQFGYGLYALTFEPQGQCSVEVFDVPTGLARARFAALSAEFSGLLPASRQTLRRANSPPLEFALAPTDAAPGLQLRLRLTEDAPGRGSASFLLRRTSAAPRSI